MAHRQYSPLTAEAAGRPRRPIHCGDRIPVLPEYMPDLPTVIVHVMKRSPAPARRTPLRRRAGLARRRWPIRSESERRSASSHYAAGARDLIRDRDGCCVLCGGPDVDAHHRLPRGRGGARWDQSRVALSRLVWLCRECHRWVESRRTLAYGLGLLVRHGITPCSAIPVSRHGRWVLLTDDGLLTPTDSPAASSSQLR
jgi:5-methylcytosine-specific restriction enzyme A